MRSGFLLMGLAALLSGCFNGNTESARSSAPGPSGTVLPRDPSSSVGPVAPPLENVYAIDVMKFGAKCDADPADTTRKATDDTAAIQAAIDSLKRGGIVLFPPKICAITNTIFVKPYVTLQGQGRLTTRIHLRSVDPGKVALDLSGSNHVMIRDMAVYVSSERQVAILAASSKELTLSNMTAQSSAYPGVGTGIVIRRKDQELDGSAFVNIYNSNFENLEIGARVGSPEDANLDRFSPEIRDAEYKRWVAEGSPPPGPYKPFTSANAINFHNCKFTSSKTGIVLENASAINIMNCYFEDNSAYGISTWTDTHSYVSSIVVQGCYFESNKIGSLIFTRKVDHATVAYNHFSTDVDSANPYPILTGSSAIYLGRNEDFKVQP